MTDRAGTWGSSPSRQLQSIHKLLDSRTLQSLGGILFEEFSQPLALFTVVDEGKDFLLTFANRAMLDLEDMEETGISGKSVGEVIRHAEKSGLLNGLKEAWHYQKRTCQQIKVYREGKLTSIGTYLFYPVEDTGSVLMIFKTPEPLNNLINSIYGFIGIYHPDGTLLECNDAPLLAAGLSRDQVIGKPFWETAWWAHSTSEQENIRKALASARDGIAVRDEFTVNIGSGQTITIDATFEPLRDKDQVIECILGFGVDITERKLAEQELLVKEEILKELELVGIFDMFEMDIQSRQVRFPGKNSFFNKMGIKTFDDFQKKVHDDDRETVVNDVREAAEGRVRNYHHIYRMRFPDGMQHFILTRAKVILDSSGRPEKLVGVSLDITNETSHGIRHDQLDNVIKDGILVCRPDGKILFANKRACSISGYTGQVLRTMYIKELMPDIKGNLTSLAEGGDTLSSSIRSTETNRRLRQAGGQIIAVRTDFNLLGIQDDNLLVVSFYDVSEFSASYQSLLQTVKELLTLTTHLYQVTEKKRAETAQDIHDQIGQSLTYIKFGLAGLMQNCPSGGACSEEHFAKIMADIDSTIKQVRHITTNLRHPLLDDIGLEAAMESQAREYRDRYGLNLELDLDIDEQELCENRKITLFRVFQESITNIARHAHASHASVKLESHGHQYKMVIKDDGIGFDPAAVNMSNMTGILGMRERVISLGGEFNIKSAHGKGTCTTVILPDSVQ